MVVVREERRQTPDLQPAVAFERAVRLMEYSRKRRPEQDVCAEDRGRQATIERDARRGQVVKVRTLSL